MGYGSASLPTPNLCSDPAGGTIGASAGMQSYSVAIVQASYTHVTREPSSIPPIMQGQGDWKKACGRGGRVTADWTSGPTKWEGAEHRTGGLWEKGTRAMGKTINILQSPWTGWRLITSPVARLFGKTPQKKSLFFFITKISYKSKQGPSTRPRNMLNPTAVDYSTEAKDQASPKITISISRAPSESCKALPVWLETVLRRLESQEDIPLLAVSMKSDTKQEVVLIRFCNSVTSTSWLPLTSTQTSVTVCLSQVTQSLTATIRKTRKGSMRSLGKLCKHSQLPPTLSYLCLFPFLPTDTIKHWTQHIEVTELLENKGRK